ncbi:hypothetical protein GCM10008955_03760 [Deinococcus malanensis]|uniref:Uncharacterized protein n=1 Tax=Deinococcus malanensis TaxID=1706855 RepID=A0ABQ2EJE2_9DEIO|nr:hypothetical protein [Deinococcus malanensis]GGK13672.1 hypothetical protein GCM10008955_03760 [Deinococcus malanensis]
MGDPPTPDVLNVQRINICEPDGTIRYVLSNRTLFPDHILIGGKAFKHPTREVAGMLFYNDEGTESGGLLFTGGEGRTAGSLSFDAYEQDQVIQLYGAQDQSGTSAFLMVSDRPDRSIQEDLEAMEGLSQQEVRELQTRHLQEDPAYYGAVRLVAGVTETDATVQLQDANGRTRLRFRVTASGDAAIEFLDADGAVRKTITADSAD